jgi:hypothetical protein
MGFEEFFFYVISEVSDVDPKFSFVYLTDELDALENFLTKSRKQGYFLNN